MFSRKPHEPDDRLIRKAPGGKPPGAFSLPIVLDVLVSGRDPLVCRVISGKQRSCVTRDRVQNEAPLPEDGPGSRAFGPWPGRQAPAQPPRARVRIMKVS
ncbi:hypothetical protein BLTE_21720 [Blastochloris tepida]|uniref:Uncharacterized protein n=1 Tax=Blastochloris tepida TaxID=2233851 RepID=A0A348G1Q4_9HYPH|nr:hypothetical protein BLTE_21720 [Blastochloris tepida]